MFILLTGTSKPVHVTSEAVVIIQSDNMNRHHQTKHTACSEPTYQLKSELMAQKIKYLNDIES